MLIKGLILKNYTKISIYITFIIIIFITACYTKQLPNLYLWQNYSEIDTSLIDSISYYDKGSTILEINVFIDNILYSIIVNDKNYIERIYTNDSNFITEEGLKIGMKTKELKRRMRNKIFLNYDCYNLPLKSNWTAYFQLSDSNNMETISPESKILYFFQEPKSLSKFEVFYYNKIKRIKFQKKNTIDK